ncbi:metallophosphoesterase [Dyella sp.]|uniref:metallophosphoesterase n=1 Tax=Dyella sp. TaxID=1869338 RepID=UPI002ED3CEF5
MLESREAHGLVRALFEGPLDVVGDVHGEIDALNDLLAVLGYDRRGHHPEGRRLVFVGDLCDRGPDSIAVMERVGEWMERGLAQCVLGNHELNLLRLAPKEGNGWYFDDDHDHAQGKFLVSHKADAASRAWIRRLIQGLPLALERSDLRVVHACWSHASIATVQSAANPDVAALHDAFRDQTYRLLDQDGTLERARQEQTNYRKQLVDPDSLVPLLLASARRDEAVQMSNPVRVLASGMERQAPEPFYSSGKWRMVERAPWWDDYRDDVAVVVGHYWRWPVTVDRAAFGKAGVDLFAGTTAGQGLGPRRNVFCVDYSVGRRFQERLRGQAFRTRLGALRWPERQIAFDDGHIIAAD